MDAKGNNYQNKKNAVANNNGTALTLSNWLDEHKQIIGQAIPKNTVDIDRFMQSAKLAIFNPRVPNLARCTPESIYRSLKDAASLGLDLSSVLGQAYLIPYNENSPTGRHMTCHFQMGYRGLIVLARRSKTIKTISCEVVYENDVLDVQLGCDKHIKHTFDIKKPRGEAVGYYCLVELENGGCQFKIMNVDDVKKHRDKFSKSYDPNDKENNWNKNFDAMALKTCCIKALKLCPISVEALEAVRKDEISDSKTADETELNWGDKVDNLDVEYTVVDAVTPTEKKETEPSKQEEKKEPVNTSDINDDEVDAAFDQYKNGSIPEEYGLF